MIHGRVQGVWYRGWAVATACELGLAGWVRNRLDGSVEAVVEGEANTIDRFVSLAQNGPPAASVARIDIQDMAIEGFSTFAQRATA
ncbi:acylphosphatase [Sphingobium sp.]|uniref:acylphosphatase n=1 Tax=Sphingobium sp. TaxID=1912891 RepID=UPI0026359AB9|nr:acylphosphatase [Sphingobium sp.]